MSLLDVIGGKTAVVAVWRQIAVLLAAVAAAGFLASCAGIGMIDANTPAEQKAAEVRRLAQERWQALIARDMERAYGFLSPASRRVTTLEQYKARINPRMYRSVRVNEVQCEAETCKVKLSLTYDHRLMKGITTPLDESWILDQGRFWYVYRS